MRIIKKHQMGGQVEDPNAAAVAAPTAEQDPIGAILQLFVQGLQAQDCNALAQGAQMFVELAQQSMAGAEGQPVFGKGGKLVERKSTKLQLIAK